ncbi:MAG: hypothetical protein M1830_007308 [Pleopsidium flavum]|nr:MAG: hypothetical protein M1830_007308 [Pleopsidium flavum]
MAKENARHPPEIRPASQTQQTQDSEEWESLREREKMKGPGPAPTFKTIVIDGKRERRIFSRNTTSQPDTASPISRRMGVPPGEGEHGRKARYREELESLCEGRLDREDRAPTSQTQKARYREE